MEQDKKNMLDKIIMEKQRVKKVKMTETKNGKWSISG